ncbi:MAG: carboxypeptidase-like regulatory domain-containing protein [Bacteroidia bacterium]|nr:carboxypeptidase-like regulatory domain-containing protein [Bacteroidia bacterium]
MRLHQLLLCVLLAIGATSLRAQQVGAKAQTKTDSIRTIVQLSGMMVDADSLQPLPFVAVVIKNSTRGVYSTPSGYYSLVVQERDTIEYFALGYKRGVFVVPDTFSRPGTITHIQALKADTVLMKEQVIYPWPSKDQFKTAFLSLNVPDDDLERAKQNLDARTMAAAAEMVRNDATMSYKYQMQQQVNRNYYAGQAPPVTLLNPVAWAQFIKAARNGDFKKKSNQ